MQDTVTPSGKWTFDDEVTNVFDDMLQRSIPQYDIMRQLCFELGYPFVQEGTDIVDLGCSRGEALAPFIDKFGAHNRYIGIEVSKPMLEASRARFQGLINCGVASIREIDLRREYPPALASITLCILTLQFTPIEYRQRILRDIFKATLAGGALLLVEKVLGSTAEIDAFMVARYLDHKKAMGYTQDQIERKRLSLEGVLVPVTAAWNEELLRMAGFSQIDCFWRWMNFAGWIAVKE